MNYDWDDYDTKDWEVFWKEHWKNLEILLKPKGEKVKTKL